MEEHTADMYVWKQDGRIYVERYMKLIMSKDDDEEEDEEALEEDVGDVLTFLKRNFNSNTEVWVKNGVDIASKGMRKGLLKTIVRSTKVLNRLERLAHAITLVDFCGRHLFLHFVRYCVVHRVFEPQSTITPYVSFLPSQKCNNTSVTHTPY